MGSDSGGCSTCASAGCCAALHGVTPVVARRQARLNLSICIANVCQRKGSRERGWVEAKGDASAAAGAALPNAGSPMPEERQ